MLAVFAVQILGRFSPPSTSVHGTCWLRKSIERDYDGGFSREGPATRSWLSSTFDEWGVREGGQAQALCLDEIAADAFERLLALRSCGTELVREKG